LGGEQAEVKSYMRVVTVGMVVVAVAVVAVAVMRLSEWVLREVGRRDDCRREDGRDLGGHGVLSIDIILLLILMSKIKFDAQKEGGERGGLGRWSQRKGGREGRRTTREIKEEGGGRQLCVGLIFNGAIEWMTRVFVVICGL
jgi:hypothetical protein